jgi:hypothetical protein
MNEISLFLNLFLQFIFVNNFFEISQSFRSILKNFVFFDAFADNLIKDDLKSNWNSASFKIVVVILSYFLDFRVFLGLSLWALVVHECYAWLKLFIYLIHFSISNIISYTINPLAWYTLIKTSIPFLHKSVHIISKIRTNSKLSFCLRTQNLSDHMSLRNKLPFIFNFQFANFSILKCFSALYFQWVFLKAIYKLVCRAV